MSGPAQTTPRRPAPPAGTGRKPTGLIVGDHVGEPAGDAAQAVRRAGMRPALDRSFGHSTDETGLVVEQDPAAGTHVARNAMITLYVAAPAPGDPSETRGERDPEEQHSGNEEPGAPSVQDTSEPSRRRRVLTDQGNEAETTEDLTAADSGRDEPTEIRAPSNVEDPFSHDGFGSPRLRRVYPRKPVGLTLRSAGRWAWRFRFTPVAALVIAAVLSGHRTGTGRNQPTTPARGAAPAPVTARPAETRRAGVVAHNVSHRKGPRHLPAPARRDPTRAVAAAASTAPARSPAISQRTPENGGGPFSP